MLCGIEASFGELIVSCAGRRLGAAELVGQRTGRDGRDVERPRSPPRATASLLVWPAVARRPVSSPRRAGGLRHVGGDVLGVLARDEVGGHQRAAPCRWRDRPAPSGSGAGSGGGRRPRRSSGRSRPWRPAGTPRRGSARRRPVAPARASVVARRALLDEQRLAVDEVVAVVLELAAGEATTAAMPASERDPDPSSTHGAGSYLSAGRREPSAVRVREVVELAPAAAATTVRATPSHE